MSLQENEKSLSIIWLQRDDELLTPESVYVRLTLSIEEIKHFLETLYISKEDIRKLS